MTPDSAYEIVVGAPGRVVVRVTVTLPEQFPYQPPVIQCVPPVPSPHSDASGYMRATAHEGLQRWNVQNNLGKVVYEVIANVIAPAAPAAGAASSGYMQPPPAPLSSSLSPRSSSAASQPPPPHYGSLGPPPAAVGSFAVGREASRRPAPDVEVPAIPGVFREVDNKSADELQRLVNDESELYLFLEDVEFYKGLNRLRDMSRDANVAQAEKNLGRKPDLDAMQRALEAMASELEELKQSYNAKLSKQKSMLEQHSPQSLLRLLEEETNRLDAETEDMSMRFLAGQTPLKEHLTRYLDRRALFHQRAAKLDSVK